jgi:hypothetical protein
VLQVYRGWFDIGEHIEASKDVPYKEYASESFKTRWDYGGSSFAQAAYMLDPEFMDHNQTSNEEVMSGFLNTADRIGILVEVRKKKAEYMPLWEKRRNLISSDPKKMDTYTFYPEFSQTDNASVQDFVVKINSQLALYKNKKGITGRPGMLLSVKSMPAYLWWDQNGSTFKELQMMARIVLAQPVGTSICERINSEFAFIKDRKRNCLGHDKANKLVALFHNLRLIWRMATPKYVEPAVDHTDSDDALFVSGVTTFAL